MTFTVGRPASFDEWNALERCLGGHLTPLQYFAQSVGLTGEIRVFMTTPNDDHTE
jgi:hypothetical protein